MKKIAVILLMGVMVLSFAACGNGNDDKNDTQGTTQNGTQNNTQNNGTNTTDNGNGTEVTNNTTNNNNTNTTTTIKDSKDILTKLWATYEKKDTDNYAYNDQFSIIGGHHESGTEGAPASYDLAKAEDLEKYHFFPKAKIDLVDDVATITHSVEPHDFSAAVYHVKDAANVDEVAKAIEDSIGKQQWADDEPDDLLIVTIKDRYVLSVFGDDDLVHYFRTSIQKVYKDSAKTIVQKEID